MHNSERDEYLPRDFIETADGLFFALIDESDEQDEEVRGWLRYRRNHEEFVKLGTMDAIKWMKERKNTWVKKTAKYDAEVHVIPKEKIKHHYRPETCLSQIMCRQAKSDDLVLSDVAEVCHIFGWTKDSCTVGLTGSCLIGAQKQTSDIDIVIYDAMTFSQCRKQILALSSSHNRMCTLRALNDDEYRDSWIRRACPGTLENYIWHEKRKGTQAVINQRKIDLALVIPGFMKNSLTETAQKIGRLKMICRITAAHQAFNQPAVYHIDNDDISVIYCFTQTYVGQAFENELVEVQGVVEQFEGGKRLIIGTSREAEGEYIRVISS